MIVEGTEDQPASALLVAREKKFLVAKVGLARKKRYFCDGTVCLKILEPFNSLIRVWRLESRCEKLERR